MLNEESIENPVETPSITKETPVNKEGEQIVSNIQTNVVESSSSEVLVSFILSKNSIINGRTLAVTICR